MYGRPKAPNFGRRAAKPAKKELTRAQRIEQRAKRAVAATAVCQIPQVRKPAPGYVVDQAELVAIPKVRRATNRRLLALVNGKRCLLRVPEVCVPEPATTVSCHSNWAALGKKGGHRKSDDSYSV